jgi:hypothetical protein
MVNVNIPAPTADAIQTSHGTQYDNFLENGSNDSIIVQQFIELSLKNCTAGNLQENNNLCTDDPNVKCPFSQNHLCW